MPSSATPLSAATAARTGSSAAALILIVDDSRSVRTLLKVYLSGRTCEFAEAGGAEEALRLLEQRPADLIITDFNMPGTDGATFTRQVRSSPHPRVRAIPIVMMTSDLQLEARRASGLSAGVSVFLPKPASCAQLMAAVDSLLPAASTRAAR